MSDKLNSYRSILKSTSIFGGVQIFQALLNIVKAKFIALLLGPVGMGVSNLLTSTLAIITTIGGLGLNYSATREISQASSENIPERLNRVYSVFSYLILFTSLIGVIILILFSSFLSKFVFGNESYKWSFIWLSITLILNILTNRNITLLQGTRRLKEMAKSTVIGSTLGLFTAIPLYYFLGILGIVPALIISGFSSFLISNYFVKKVGFQKLTLSISQAFFEGRDLVKLGFVMMIASLMGTIVTFLVNSFIGRFGSLTDVGLYSGGIAITNQFVSLVFTAMSVDYFPRLAAICNDNRKVAEMVNQQSEITLMILFPLLVALILAAPLLINLLLSAEFQILNSFVRIIAVGTIFQAAGYTISWIPMAKGDKKVFFIWNALFGNFLGLVFFTIGYRIFGLDGLAISIVFQHIISFIAFVFVTKKLYEFTMSNKFKFLLLVSSLFLGFEFFVVANLQKFYGYIFGTILLFIACGISFYYLNKVIGIKESINILLNKKVR